MSPDQYLASHAEPEAAAAAHLEGSFGHVVQVPAYGEGDELFAMLGSVPAGPRGKVLIVLVLNARADSPAAVHAANEAARARLTAAASTGARLSDDPPVTILAFPHGRVVLIDRAAPGRFLPEGQGIGLARKIGCDFALAAAASGQLAADWLHCTDADVLLPNDYFDQTEVVEGAASAAVYFFRHRFDAGEALGRAGRLTRSRCVTECSAWRGRARPTPTRPWEAASRYGQRPTRRCAAFRKRTPRKTSSP